MCYTASWCCQSHRRSEAAAAQERRQRLLNGPPFMLLMRCRAKGEAHTTEYFVFPLKRRAEGTNKRLFRLCKVGVPACIHCETWQ